MNTARLEQWKTKIRGCYSTVDRCIRTKASSEPVLIQVRSIFTELLDEMDKADGYSAPDYPG